jgi:MIP family channel proteins
MGLAANILIAFLLAPATAEQAGPTAEACASDGNDGGLHDATVLLQTITDKTSGASRPKSSADAETGEQDSTASTIASLLASGAVEDATQLLAKSGMITKGLAEMVAMTLFVFIGCGSAMAVAHEPGWLFQVSLTFGFAITALAYSIGHISGGQINAAVTFGLWLSGHLSIAQALVNVAFQLLGAILGSMLTMAVFSEKTDKTGGLGTNAVAEGFTYFQAFTAEVWGTALLVFVVLETAINPATAGNRALACMAIGISVFLSHSVLIPIDGCSINPTRSFGPMVVRKIFRNDGADNKYVTDHWVFWVGPLVGALAAVGIYNLVH